jgi:hyperosmotically inducible protein
MQTHNECKPMNLPDSVFVSVMLSAVPGLSGCQLQGTGERAGKKNDQADEQAGNKLEAAKDKTHIRVVALAG